MCSSACDHLPLAPLRPAQGPPYADQRREAVVGLLRCGAALQLFPGARRRVLFLHRGFPFLLMRSVGRFADMGSLYSCDAKMTKPRWRWFADRGPCGMTPVLRLTAATRGGSPCARLRRRRHAPLWSAHAVSNQFDRRFFGSIPADSDRNGAPLLAQCGRIVGRTGAREIH